MSIGSIISSGLDPLVDLIYPPRCPLCGDAIARHGNLCTGCWNELVIPGGPACISCGRPFAADHPEEERLQCAPCLADPPRHAGISAGTLYSDASRKLVLAFKHGGKIALAPLLARMIASRLPLRDARSDQPLLVPVPLHRWRLWQRGYNQAALLARELEKLGKGKAVLDALVRRKATPRLGGLGRRARKKVLVGAIVINPRRIEQIRGCDIVLVDDVLTSGATTNACVGQLLKAGAASVRIACFARVLDEGVADRARGGVADNAGPDGSKLDSTMPENITPEAV